MAITNKIDTSQACALNRSVYSGTVTITQVLSLCVGVIEEDVFFNYIELPRELLVYAKESDPTGFVQFLDQPGVNFTNIL